ncbi:50S ribosomal protein L32e [Candidatus Pacearchaeota archaeon]|nr:50S ribosomal protein L32e [Candidatus Pacearchaeota archaeon]
MKFLRRTWYKLPSLGKGRKKKQKWRNPTGRHNKIRNKRRGYSARVEIGYKTDRKARGRINEKIPKKIFNAKQLENIGKNEIAVIGKIGMKKKIEIAKKAKEMKIEIHNLNLKKFLKGKNFERDKK